MRKQFILTAVLLLISCVTLFAQADSSATTSGGGGGIDWFELMIGTGYLLGVFVLLPIIIYTNLKERLFNTSSDKQEEIQPIEGLNEDEKNNRAALILESIEEKMTPFQSEDGEDMVTITSGKQAKFTKQGLDYINKKLVPTNPEVIERVNEFTAVYEDRTRRAFTGSKWVIASSAVVGILFLYMGGISTFIFVHFLGLLFYILSSRTTFYGIDKRMEYFGGGIGMIGAVMSGLFLGDGTKYYVKESGGSWKRDWETEGQMALIGLVLLFIAAMILGFFAAFLGVVNFVINYSTSFLLPLKSDEDWYEKNLAVI